MTVLLLNASYEPIRVVSTKRAVMLVLQEKAEVLEAGEEPVRSASFSMQAPKVIRLTRYVQIPYRARLPLTRRNLLVRDSYTCAYCRGHANTIDHVVPRSKGGPHRWENVVAACSPCNAKKEDKSLEQLGWHLPFTPHAPKGTLWLLVGTVQPDPSWEPYLGVVPA